MAVVFSNSYVEQHVAWPTFCGPDHVSVLAGNSRLDVTPDGSIKVDAQMKAFKAALLQADAVRRWTGVLPPVSIAFDHKGDFRRHFLRAGLSHSHSQHLRLSHLRTEIINTFAPIADALHIPLEHIQIIYEDSARTHVGSLLSTAGLSLALQQRMDLDSANDDPAYTAPEGPYFTCAAITSEYFCKAADAGSVAATEQTVLEVFFEPAPWSEMQTYQRGLQLTHALGRTFGIRLHLVTQEGVVSQGEIAYGACAELFA